MRTRLLVALSLAAALWTSAAAQAPRALAVAASSGAALDDWSDRTAAMVQDGRLEIAAVQRDTMIEGRRHERLAQHHNGLPVFGAVLMRQSDGLSVRSVFGRIYEDVRLSGVARLDEAAAGLAATKAVGPDSTVAGEAVLGILPVDRGYALAWRMTVRTSRDVRDVYVDARTGEVLRSDSRLRRQIGPVGIGLGVFGDEKKISASRSSGPFEARDTARPGVLETYDFRGSQPTLERYFTTGQLTAADLARDDDNDWRDGSVVDAHVYQGWTYDYFFKRFARSGMDGRNGGIASIVHPLARAEAGAYDEEDVSLFINNALYLGSGEMLFGDGDGERYGWFAGGLDIVAHEWTHGVTEYTSNLEYRDEPGALSESFSDIMGAATEFYFQPPGPGRRQADWLIGEDVVLRSPGFIRSLADPASSGHPDHYSLVEHIGTDVDNGGIHTNAGVPNHAFYLAVAGGRNRISGITVQGIGVANIERMERIFYRAFTLFLGPTAGFRDARLATLQAATELYGAGSIEHAQLALAWTAVGVN